MEIMSKLPLKEMENTAVSYQELMVPALFENWPDPVLDEANIEPGHKVLDIACGTGVLAIAAADRLNHSGFVTGLDTSSGMLSVVGKLAPDIECHQGTAEYLPWENRYFDAVVSQFGLMFFEDQQKALQEMYRILKPGGRLVVTVFDALEKIPGYRIMTGIFAHVVGEGVAEALSFPFSLGNTNELQSLCSKSALSRAKITTREGRARFPDVKTMVLADVKGGVAGIVLDKHQIDEVISMAESELKEFIAADGSVELPMPAHFIMLTKY